METSVAVGWTCSVICLVFTLRCAFAFAKNEPGYFLALTVYAAQWGVLIVYYSTNDLTKLKEFLPALSGYLSAIVGSLIYRIKLDKDTHIKHHIFQRESLFAWLLLTLTLPEALKLPLNIFPAITTEEMEKYQASIEIIVTLLLTTIGYYSLFLAIKKACIVKSLANIVSFCLLIYWVLELSYTIRWFFYSTAMNSFFLYSFAIIKLVTTFLFIPSILISIPSFKKSSFIDKVFEFLHIKGE